MYHTDRNYINIIAQMLTTEFDFVIECRTEAYPIDFTINELLILLNFLYL